MRKILRLAQVIEWVHAKERARLRHPALPRHGRRWREAVMVEYDEHAAAELALLIERTLA